MPDPKTTVLDASSFTRITHGRPELPTIFNSVVTSAIDSTSDDMKQAIEDCVGGCENANLENFTSRDRADALIINAIIFTMLETGCPSDAIGKLVKIPSRYFEFFQLAEKGFFGTPTSEDLGEMFGEA